MRVSTSQVYQQVTDSLMRTLSELVRLNEQVASGKKINRPSDDPSGTARALDYQVTIDAAVQYRKNVDAASSFIGFAENTLSSVSSALTRAKELAVQGAGTQTAESRSAIEKEVSQLRDHLLSLSNSRFGDRYVFSGFRTDVPAFDSTSLAYQGDAGTINVAVDGNATIPVNVAGSDAFGYSQPAEEVVQIEAGKFVHYIPAGGTTVNVEIRAADDTTVLDSFSFDNMIEMTDLLSGALAGNNADRVTALLKPLDDALGHVSDVRADLGARLNRLEDQGSRLDNVSYLAESALSGVQDADIARTASDIARAGTTLQALQASSAKILSQSLLDFLD